MLPHGCGVVSSDSPPYSPRIACFNHPNSSGVVAVRKNVHNPHPTRKRTPSHSTFQGLRPLPSPHLSSIRVETASRAFRDAVYGIRASGL